MPDQPERPSRKEVERWLEYGIPEGNGVDPDDEGRLCKAYLALEAENTALRRQDEGHRNVQRILLQENAALRAQLRQKEEETLP